jgi:TRAP-type C4-dicarboxylate transport system permease small subunit
MYRQLLTISNMGQPARAGRKADAMAGGRVFDKSKRVLAAADIMVVAANRWLMIAALGAMAVLVFIGVALRYLTNDTLVWAEELSRYLMIWLAFLGIGPVLRVGAHVAVDSLVEALSPALQKLLRIIVLALVAGCSIWLIYAGWAYTARSWFQTTPVLGVPFAYVALAAPVGFALSLWHLLMVAARYVADGTFDVSDDIDPQQAAAS